MSDIELPNLYNFLQNNAETIDKRLKLKKNYNLIMSDDVMTEYISLDYDVINFNTRNLRKELVMSLNSAQYSEIKMSENNRRFFVYSFYHICISLVSKYQNSSVFTKVRNKNTLYKKSNESGLNRNLISKLDHIINKIIILEREVNELDGISKKLSSDLKSNKVQFQYIKKCFEILYFESKKSNKVVTLIFNDLYKMIGAKFINNFLLVIAKDLEVNSIAYNKAKLKTLKNMITIKVNK